jgi:hypothetical protein
MNGFPKIESVEKMAFEERHLGKSINNYDSIDIIISKYVS